MPAPWVVQDLPDMKLQVRQRSGALVCEVPQASIDSVEWELCKEGKLDFSLGKGVGPYSLILPGQHEAQLWWKGNPIWTGPIWTAKSKAAGVQYNCQGLLSYFRRRFVLNATITYTSIEQTTIANNLVTAAQTGFANMDFHVGTTTSVGGSTHIRSRNYKREEHKCFYDLLQEFPGIRDGFEFEVVVDVTGTQRLFTAFYPAKQVVQSNIGLEYGRNIADYDTTTDTFAMENRVYVTGGSANGVKFENNYEDTVSEGIYGQMQGVHSDGQENDVTYLLDEAHRYVEIGKNPSVIVKPTAVEVPQALLDVIHVGDLVPVHIDDYDCQVSGQQRVQKIKWTPQDGKLSYEFVQPVVLT